MAKGSRPKVAKQSGDGFTKSEYYKNISNNGAVKDTGYIKTYDNGMTYAIAKSGFGSWTITETNTGALVYSRGDLKTLKQAKSWLDEHGGKIKPGKSYYDAVEKMKTLTRYNSREEYDNRKR